MKITEIELHEIHPPLRAWNREAHQLFAGHAEETSTIIVLRTDNGLEGLGEFSSSISEEIRQELEQLRGTNPCRWRGHPERGIWAAPARSERGSAGSSWSPRREPSAAGSAT